MNPARGRFIVVDGIEGAGKTTQLETLRARLEAAGLGVVCTREPGGTPLGEELRELLLRPRAEGIAEDAELLLMFAARAEHIAQVIEPALARGDWVLCDRFTDASYAYQGGGRGFDRGVLAQLETWVQEGRQPDLTLWFDIAPAVAAQRRASARAPDRFEGQDRAFFERVVAGYAARCAADPERFARLMTLCACDFHAFPGRATRPYPKARLLATALEACRGIDPAALQDDHADDPEAAAQALLEARAMAVARWLVTQGIDCHRLIPVGFGHTRLRAPGHRL